MHRHHPIRLTPKALAVLIAFGKLPISAVDKLGANWGWSDYEYRVFRKELIMILLMLWRK
jgi:hypothetical protein